MENITFDKQVVLVTGAGRGLGAAYAKLFARRGATVVVHDAGVARDGTGHNPGPAQAVAAEIKENGGSAIVETQNLSDRAACNALVDNVLAQCGRLDVLVHSAGLVTYHGITDTTETEWQRLLRINVEAPFWLCQAVWPTMIKQQYGRIVLSVSGYGLKTVDNSDVTAYGVGKAAQFGLMNGLAGEGKVNGILVNAISPVAATRIFRRAVSENELLPDSVAPATVLLGSKACPFTGKVLGAAGGRFTVGEFQAQRQFELGPETTPEAVLEAIEFEEG